MNVWHSGIYLEKKTALLYSQEDVLQLCGFKIKCTLFFKIYGELREK